MESQAFFRHLAGRRPDIRREIVGRQAWLWRRQVLSPSSPPHGGDQPEYKPDEDDRCRDLYPKEAPKLPQNNFGLGAPITRKSVADTFDRVRARSQRPSYPFRPVEEYAS